MCGEHKRAVAFTRSTMAKNGLQSYCKPCMTERTKRLRQTRAAPQQQPPSQLVCGSRCGRLEPAAAFNKASGTLFGVRPMCRACEHRQCAERYAAASEGADAGWSAADPACAGSRGGSDSTAGAALA